VNPWENSALTLRPLPDHVTVFNWGFLSEAVGEFRTNVAAVAGSCDCVQLNWGFLSEPVGEFRTNVAAVAGSCDCVQLGWVLCEPVGEFRTNVAAVARSCDCVSTGDLGEPVGESALILRPLPDHCASLSLISVFSLSRSDLCYSLRFCRRAVTHNAFGPI